MTNAFDQSSSSGGQSLNAMAEHRRRHAVRETFGVNASERRCRR